MLLESKYDIKMSYTTLGIIIDILMMVVAELETSEIHTHIFCLTTSCSYRNFAVSDLIKKL